MILICCNWVSPRWQWSADLNKNRKETVQKAKQHKKLKKHRMHKIENKNAKNTKGTLKNTNPVIRI